MAFDYNQLNIVGRDESSVKFIQDVLIKELKNLRDKVSPNGANFKNVVNTAGQVWAGDDETAFVRNFTDAATKYETELSTLITNIQTYFTTDINQFNELQKKTLGITSK